MEDGKASQHIICNMHILMVVTCALYRPRFWNRRQQLTDETNARRRSELRGSEFRRKVPLALILLYIHQPDPLCAARAYEQCCPVLSTSTYLQ